MALMMADRRRIAIAFMETEAPCNDRGYTDAYHWAPFSYGAYRVLAAAAAEFPNDDVRIFRGLPGQIETLHDEIEAFAPDVFGASCYVWSFPPLLDVASRLKQRRPDCTVILGGPCGHPVMLGLAPFEPFARYIDALIPREGEEAFNDILRLPARPPDALMTVPGVLVRTPFGFTATSKRQHQVPLDEIPSPFRMGLYPSDFTPHLERFRGCPLSCSFCDWGAHNSVSRVVSKDWLVEELEIFRRLGADSVFLVDAGINLSARAFRNLAEAERETGVLRDVGLGFMAYPDYVRDEHVEFLSNVKIKHASVGLQSMNEEVLRRVHRNFDLEKFRRGVTRLSELSEIIVEIILGLPGDSPDSFMRTLDNVLNMSDRVSVLIHHCLALPDGLLTRGPENAGLDFDPYTLRVKSCEGWSERDLGATHERLAALVEQLGGRVGDLWYQVRLPGQRAGHIPTGEMREFTGSNGASGSARSAPPMPVPAELIGALDRSIEEATVGAWRFVDASRSDDNALTVRISTATGEVVLDLRADAPGRRSFRVVDGIAWSHQGEFQDGQRSFARLLERTIEHSRPLSAMLHPIISATGDPAVTSQAK
jgi:radical SAM superfamily enzyme YgiQ (UPF0313 family)